MPSTRRLASPPVFAGAFGVMCLVLLMAVSSPAAAKAKHKARPMNYGRLNKIQRRLVSEPLALALGPKPHVIVRGNSNGDGGVGADGLPSTPPTSYGTPGAVGSPVSYFPTSDSGCAASFGGNVKVNQNCLNISDKDLQGRAQANNESFISVNPFNTRQLVASDNNYIRGDGTCGAYYSRNGGRSWTDSTVPNGFTRGGTVGSTTYPREYWQGGGDTSVAWDTRGNAYISCQVFNRGSGTSPNPDQSSAFLLFRSTQNGGASWNFPGRYSTPFMFAPQGTPGLEDKALMTVDDNVSSPYRDRIYVSWTEFAADGTAYIYESHSDDYGQTFSGPVVVSTTSPLCTNTYGVPTPKGTCNENQFSDPFVGPDGNLYVAWANYNNTTSGDDNRNQILLAKSTDGGQSFSAPVKVSDYYELPDCATYQHDDPGRACVPEKGSSTISVFRAANYPSGQVDPQNPKVVAVTFGSYINRDSNESNGCTPAGFNPAFGTNLYEGVKTPGACNNKIVLSVSKDGGASFTGTSADPRTETVVNQAPGQLRTDQFFQWTAFTRSGTLAVDYYDRQYGNDETTGSSDFSLSGSNDLLAFGQTRVTTSSMPAPTEFYGTNGGLFYGDYVGLTAANKAYPIWSDTRSPDLFVCPDTAAPGTPPQLCTGTESNGQQANDENTFTATVNVPTGNNHARHTRRARTAHR